MQRNHRVNNATLPPLTPNSNLPESAFSMEQQRQIDGLRATLESLERRYNSQEKFVRTLKPLIDEVRLMREAIRDMGPLKPSQMRRPAKRGSL